MKINMSTSKPQPDSNHKTNSNSNSNSNFKLNPNLNRKPSLNPAPSRIPLSPLTQTRTPPVSLHLHSSRKRSDAPSTTFTRTATTRRRIRPTNEDRISQLWKQVMAPRMDDTSPTYLRSTRSSSQRSKRGGLQGGSATPPIDRSMDSMSISEGRARLRAITLDHPQYQSLVLEPRQITVDGNTLSVEIASHFGKEIPPRYESLPGLENTGIWLKDDNNFAKTVMREYERMTSWQLPEAEYHHYALQYLLKSDICDPSKPVIREWLTKRLIQPVLKLQQFWDQPPLLTPKSPSIQKDYSFDVRPDCQYWISLDAFNSGYHKLVRQLVLVQKYRDILCPYFTVEFKKEGGDLQKAQFQIATASSLALYNRFRLKERRLRETSKSWNAKRLACLRHYGLTFAGTDFTFWCIQPKEPAVISLPTESTAVSEQQTSWRGCRMFRVEQDSCSTLAGVKSLIAWINVIHWWGLTEYGPKCEKDVKFIIQNNPNTLRTSLGPGGDLPRGESDTDAENEEEPPMAPG